MSLYIVDASVAAKWFIEEEYAEKALTLLRGSHQLHAPDFFLLEMDNILCKWTRRGLITESVCGKIRLALTTISIEKHPFATLRDSAFTTAIQSGISIYDGLYLALAAALDGRMVTADRRLYQSLAQSPLARNLLWVEDLA